MINRLIDKPMLNLSRAAQSAILIAVGTMAFIALLATPVLAEDSPEQLLNTTQKAHNEERAANAVRVSGFQKSEQQLQSELDALKQQRDALEKQTAQLAAQFQANEASLADKEKALHLATGSLGELFGVVRQSAKDLQIEQRQSVASIGQDEHITLVDELVAAKKLPAKNELYGLWAALQQQIDASDQLTPVTVTLSSGSGELSSATALRLGSFGLIGDSGYLQWDGANQRASSYPVQPKQAPTLASLNALTGSDSDMSLMALDVTRGDLIAQLANVPTLQDRINHGGIVGQIIIGLLVVGVLIGVVRGGALLLTNAKINKQLKSAETPTEDNALGRILSVYQQDSSPNVEALELRLLEAVMDEQQHLERGLSMIKLLAALAPMLGLLGTVTGMIETFQTITQFGNADPRVMAGGISMALITTVLGLIAAMPLLLIHNVLSSKAESVRNILEKQGIGLVAERAEQQTLAKAA